MGWLLLPEPCHEKRVTTMLERQTPVAAKVATIREGAWERENEERDTKSPKTGTDNVMTWPIN